MQRPSGTISFLFTDVEGSTRAWDEHPEAMKVAMARHDDAVRSVIEEHDGFIFTTAGDEFCAAFASPRSALQTAVAIQVRLATVDWSLPAPLRVRMAVHTGNADERDGDYFGPPLNRCSRLLSLGSGGQILVSEATELLVRDNDLGEIELVDLGAHRLRDLKREEHIYQITHPQLPSEFAPLPSAGPIQDAADRLSAGRQAYQAEQWRTAYDALQAADELIALDGADLERLAQASFWLGYAKEAISTRERAFARFAKEGKKEEAARAALVLAELFHHRLADSVAAGWQAKAERLLADRQDGAAYGYLKRWQTVLAFERDGDVDRALRLAAEVYEIGTSLGDADLVALGLQDQGRILVAMGRVAEGMTLIDEAMASSMGGEVDPETMGRSYCNMLSVCNQVADYRRAGEWVEATASWCEAHPDSAFPGICRIYKADLKWRQGNWSVAQSEARAALEQLAEWTDVAAAAWYQLGEIELRSGNFDAANEAFRAAHAGGASPLPGLALLKLHTGDTAGAIALLERAVTTPQSTPLARARLLPAWIDVMLASDRADDAEKALEDLDSAAALTSSPALAAAVQQRRAELALRAGDVEAAKRAADSSLRGWNALKMPYEVAQLRLLLSRIHEASGNPTGAELERDAARAVFKQLGADHDLARLDA